MGERRGSRGPFVEVDDPSDARLAPFRDLNEPARRAQLEAEGSIFVVEGRLAVERLLDSPYEVRSLLVDDHQVVGAAGLVSAVRARGAPVYVGSRAVVAATVGFALHRGVVATAARPNPADADQVLGLARAVGGAGLTPLVAVLEGLNDHENIGALFRNAAAFAVGAVLLDPTCADPLYRRSVRVSVGHVLRVPFARLSPWPDGIGRLRAAGFLVAALAPRDDAGHRVLPLAQLSAGVPGRHAGVALLLGAEGPGLSPAARQACDAVVAIPMAEGVDSLNVATAAAVAFYALRAP